MKSKLDEAKTINDIKKIISKGDHRKNYNIVIIYDGASEYFCNKLSRSISVFERKLREFIYLTVILEYKNEWASKTINTKIEKSLKEKGVSKNKFVENALEGFSFDNYIMYLFEKRPDIEFESARDEALEELSKLNPDTYKIKEILKNTVQRSLWEKLFDKYNLKFSNEDLNNVKKIRNKVMHNKEIDFIEYEESKKLLKKLNKIIEQGIKYINESRYNNKIDYRKNLESLKAFSYKISKLNQAIIESIKTNQMTLQGIVYMSTAIKENINIANSVKLYQDEIKDIKNI